MSRFDGTTLQEQRVVNLFDNTNNIVIYSSRPMFIIDQRFIKNPLTAEHIKDCQGYVAFPFFNWFVLLGASTERVVELMKRVETYLPPVSMIARIKEETRNAIYYSRLICVAPITMFWPQTEIVHIGASVILYSILLSLIQIFGSFESKFIYALHNSTNFANDTTWWPILYYISLIYFTLTKVKQMHEKNNQNDNSDEGNNAVQDEIIVQINELHEEHNGESEEQELDDVQHDRDVHDNSNDNDEQSIQNESEDANERRELVDDANERRELDEDANERRELDDDANERRELVDDANERRELVDDANERRELDDDANEHSELVDDANEPRELDDDANERRELVDDANERRELDDDEQSVESFIEIEREENGNESDESLDELEYNESPMFEEIIDEKEALGTDLPITNFERCILLQNQYSLKVNHNVFPVFVLQWPVDKNTTRSIAFFASHMILHQLFGFFLHCCLLPLALTFIARLFFSTLMQSVLFQWPFHLFYLATEDFWLTKSIFILTTQIIQNFLAKPGKKKPLTMQNILSMIAKNTIRSYVMTFFIPSYPNWSIIDTMHCNWILNFFWL